METAYNLSRASKALLWFCVVVCVAGIGAVGFAEVRLVHKFSSNLTVGKLAVALFGVVFSVLVAIMLGALAVAARRMLRDDVTLSTDWIRVGRRTVQLADVQSIIRPKRTIGLAFRLVTRGGENVDVSGIENARQLEEAIRQRLRTVNPAAAEPTSEFLFGAKWSAGLIAVELISCAGSVVAFVGLISRVAGASTGDPVIAMLSRIPFAVLLVGLAVFTACLQAIRRISTFRVVVSGQAIRLGERVVKWTNIRGVAEPRLPGVAFRIVTREGEVLNVYSGIESVRELESLIANRISSA